MSKKYTFRFLNQDERKFREILGRIEESGATFNIIQDIHIVDGEDEKDKDPRTADKTCVIEMDEFDALPFRMGMEPIRIVPERTEEEQAARNAREDAHKIRVTIHTPMGDGK
jgi:hypothetical protein